MLNEKQRIALSFNKSAAHYDQASTVQKRAGDHLIDQLAAMNLHSRSLLDIGCGSGAVTQQAAERLNWQYMSAVDIAPDLLARAQKRLTKPGQQAIVGDFDCLPLADGGFDLILSNMALQWSMGLDKTLAEISRVLQDQGVLALTFPIRGTFHQLTAAKQRVDLSSRDQPFLSSNQLLEHLRAGGFHIKQQIVRRHTCYYPNIHALLSAIKKTGATCIKHQPAQPVGRRYFHDLQQHYPKAADNSLPLSYIIQTIIAIKT